MTGKRDRNNFYQQKIKLKNIKSSTIVNQSAGGEQDETTVQNIYINESLTQENRKLLKEAKREANKLKYRYPGYTVNGEIRVRKSANENHISILCKSDLDKITGIQTQVNTFNKSCYVYLIYFIIPLFF